MAVYQPRQIIYYKPFELTKRLQEDYGSTAAVTALPTSFQTSQMAFVNMVGKEGPLSGKLSNPGDMMAVVSIGGTKPDGQSPFSGSRGMTAHRLDHFHQSYSRVKSDTVACACSLSWSSCCPAKWCNHSSRSNIENGSSLTSLHFSGSLSHFISALSKVSQKESWQAR